jgi:predicted anti-sigma-YlaC factor YlaD
MNKNIKNIDKIDKYLKGVALPEHISEQHRRQLRRQILNRIERRQTMFVRKRAWKVAAVLAILIGAGAISVVGVNIGRYYYYMGRDDDGAPIFRNDGRYTRNESVCVQI